MLSSSDLQLKTINKNNKFNSKKSKPKKYV